MERTFTEAKTKIKLGHFLNVPKNLSQHFWAVNQIQEFTDEYLKVKSKQKEDFTDIFFPKFR